MLDLSILNEPQRKAVETTEGPLLILAGAGSGKTRVLTYRIAYILATGLAGPDNILAMTFTNKAAGEMKERVEALLEDLTHPADTGSPLSYRRGDGGEAAPTWMGTFHSICVRILKMYGEHVGLSKNFTIYDSSDQQLTIKEAMDKARVSTKEFNPRAIHNYISSAKNELIDANAYATYAQGYFQQAVAATYPHYQNIMRENNAVDFDDLIMLTIQLFEKSPDVLKRFQEQFKYILVDEYQDTNHAQYVLVSKLAAHYKNICCVGDDDQSIYAFRGATIRNILNFEKDYPDCTVIKLEQNYRSTKKILEASYQVISKNKSRKDKKLWTDNDDGENITIYTAKDEKDEAKWVVERIVEISFTPSPTSYDATSPNGRGNHELPLPLGGGRGRDASGDMRLSEIAVLYRTNAQSRSLEEAFINANIPYRIVGGVRFYDRKEIKDIISYLRVLYNPRDSKSLERIINVPRRGIGGKALESLTLMSRKNSLSPTQVLLDENQELDNPKIKQFGVLMKDLHAKTQALQLIDLMQYVLDATGYIKMLDDGTSEGEARIENIKELLTVAVKYNELPAQEGLEKFLEDVSLLESASENQDNNSEKVTLMTIHSAKGLEFEYVFVVGVEENLFPHSNSSMDIKELEEERRLAYVAITRAKKHLYLIHADSRIYFGTLQRNPISRFLEDIDPALVTFEKANGFNYSDAEEVDFDEYFAETKEKVVNTLLNRGDKVKHDYFGIGTVVMIDDEIIEVDFGATYGVKELMLEYAKLTKY